MSSQQPLEVEQFCPCGNRYGDLHEACFSCLGLQHALAGLAKRPACVVCAALPEEERMLRASFFTAPERDELEELVSIAAAAGEMPCHQVAPPPPSVHLPSEDESGSEAGEPSSASVRSRPAPAAFDRDLPRLLDAAASYLRIPLPEAPPPAGVPLWDSINYGRPGVKAARPLPAMPNIENFVEAGWERPLSLRAPLTQYLRSTRVEGWAELAARGTPPLERDIASVLLPGSAAWGSTRRPVLPDARGRLTMSLADRCFSLAAQAVAASSSVAMLAVHIGQLAAEGPSAAGEGDRLSAIADAAGAINQLTRASSACAGGVMATSVVQQRHLWLSLTKMKEDNKGALLNSPISKVGLFGGAVTEIMEDCRTQEADRRLIAQALSVSASAPSVPRAPPAEGKPGGKRSRKSKHVKEGGPAKRQPESQGSSSDRRPPSSAPSRGPAPGPPPQGAPPAAGSGAKSYNQRRSSY